MSLKCFIDGMSAMRREADRNRVHVVSCAFLGGAQRAYGSGSPVLDLAGVRAWLRHIWRWAKIDSASL